ncbi:hypothetical protein [Phaeodactylibacter luteus]|uniref:Uncharacterized protein n=1 Tax=Phaeodactylibacter luteus TaxID=1564516 RepID=A0A5C6RJ91_9BACT|nr:hypothetical protein [Phaeodactylibacter luteus]TXB62267.1 hypothetical protein FRY97_15115 [Phaeodactylibacter luteus]
MKARFCGWGFAKTGSSYAENASCLGLLPESKKALLAAGLLNFISVAAKSISPLRLCVKVKAKKEKIGLAE